MEANQPNPDDKDKFVKGIPIDAEETPAPEPKKSEEEKEPEPAKVEEKSKDTPSGDEPGDEDEKEKSPLTQRPEKYIPVAKYTDEKRQWGEDKAAYEKRISELESIKDGNQGSKKTEDAIKAYAEKYNVTEESVKELAKIFTPPTEEKKPEVKPAEFSDEQKQQIAEAEQIKAEKLYDTEFTDVATPALKNLYPNATPEQLAKAKKELEVLATTAGYLDKSLDFIVWKEQQSLGKIFAEKQVRKGPENGNKAPTKNSDLSADDFKGVKDFSELSNLSVSDRDAIVKKFDNPTWTAYKNWVKANDDLAIS